MNRLLLPDDEQQKVPLEERPEWFEPVDTILEPVLVPRQPDPWHIGCLSYLAAINGLATPLYWLIATGPLGPPPNVQGELVDAAEPSDLELAQLIELASGHRELREPFSYLLAKSSRVSDQAANLRCLMVEAGDAQDCASPTTAVHMAALLDRILENPILIFYLSPIGQDVGERLLQILEARLECELVERSQTVEQVLGALRTFRPEPVDGEEAHA